MVEKVNRTIQTRLLKLFMFKNWINHLPQVVQNYNNSYHSSIKMAPSEVAPKNLYLVRRHLYPPLSKNNRKKLKMVIFDHFPRNNPTLGPI